MKINEEMTISEEQVLFNKLSYEEQQFILKQMILLQPCELSCELEEEKKIPEKLEEFDIQGLEVSGYSMSQAEYLLEDGVKENREMINWILDYLKSKGDE